MQSSNPGGARETLEAAPAPSSRNPARLKLLNSDAARGAPGPEPKSAVTSCGLRAPAMLALERETDAIARSEISVLIQGETGVGKDVLARSIHARSRRAGGPFLRVNCSALAEGLLESELFGYERGAFTGALEAKTGLFEAAAGGTLFLDEIGEFPRPFQAKLLSALETREILAVGGTRARPIDVRFIAATNRDLEAEATLDNFRRDLYFRIAGYTAHVPPLRQRRAEIIPLSQEFLRRAARDLGLACAPALRADAAAELMGHTWPGNVRELRNVIERAVALSRGASIGSEHLPFSQERRPATYVRELAPNASSDRSDAVPGFSAEELCERRAILDALLQAAGNQSKAAALLGMSRSTLLNRLDAYRIPRPRKRVG
jgi:two-component system, NtrC family, response regulator AtoC